MKTVEIDSEQFEQIIYVAVATTQADDVAQLRMTSKVLDKLEGQAVAKPDDQGYKLINDRVTFEFEDAEASFILKRISDMIPQLQGWAARRILPVIDQLET